MISADARLLSACRRVFVYWVVGNASYAPEFVKALARSPIIFKSVFQLYLDKQPALSGVYRTRSHKPYLS